MMIIKYFEWLKILPDERHRVYELARRDPNEDDGVKTIKTLTKEEAMEMIRTNNLLKVYSDEDGTIWENESDQNENPIFIFSDDSSDSSISDLPTVHTERGEDSVPEVIESTLPNLMTSPEDVVKAVPKNA